jgi:hypothetical protein
MSSTQSTPDFSVAEHYGLRNTTCLYSKDVASVDEDNECSDCRPFLPPPPGGGRLPPGGSFIEESRSQ